MSARQFELLDGAAHEVRGYVALLDIVKDHLNSVSIASEELKAPTWKDYTVYLLTPGQAFAFDFIVNKVIAATDDLTDAFDAYERP